MTMLVARNIVDRLLAYGDEAAKDPVIKNARQLPGYREARMRWRLQFAPVATANQSPADAKTP